MNPDTNKFEELFEKQREALEPYIDKLNEKLETTLVKRLYRPNGEPVPEHWSVFTVGEKVVVNNHTFKIAHIGEAYMVLEPVGIHIVGGEDE